MPPVKPFVLDQWIAKHRPLCKTTLHDSCVAPLTVADLRHFGENAAAQAEAQAQNSDTADVPAPLPGPLDESIPLSYGTIRGSERLRELVAATICPGSAASGPALASTAASTPESASASASGSNPSPASATSKSSPPESTNTNLTASDILITSGAISANFLILDTLCGPEDHVVVQYPTYSQLFEVPRRAGAEVSLWRLREQRCGRNQGNWDGDEDGGVKWVLDLEELRGMVKANTKMIVLNNPGNPVGNVLPRALLEGVVDVARGVGALVMCDEVFRPLFHSDASGGTGKEIPPSLMELGYERSIVVGSMSKAYALPGIRLGWLATHPALSDTISQDLVHARDYTTIAVSQLDDQIASFALSPTIKSQILSRSNAITTRNLEVLEAWVARHKGRVRWAKPEGAGTALVTILGRDGRPIDDGKFAASLAMEEGVLVPPAGVCFGHEGEGDLKGGLRIGIVMGEGMLEDGLAGIGRLLERWE